MKKLVILLIVIAMCLVGCTTNDLDVSGDATNESTVNSVESTNNTDSTEGDINSSIKDDYDIVSPTSLDELESEILKDVEGTIDGLKADWEELKSEIDTYEKYSNNTDKVEEFYEKINDSTEQVCIRLQKYTARYAELILSSNMSISEKREAFDDLLACIYDDASNELLNGIYEELLGDMQDTFYDGVLSDSNVVDSYLEWYNIHINEYQNWYNTSIDVYRTWYDTTIDIYSFYNDMTIELFTNDVEGAKEKLKDFEEDIEKLY